jgi:hypothetical protein
LIRDSQADAAVILSRHTKRAPQQPAMSSGWRLAPLEKRLDRRPAASLPRSISITSTMVDLPVVAPRAVKDEHRLVAGDP